MRTLCSACKEKAAEVGGGCFIFFKTKISLRDWTGIKVPFSLPLGTMLARVSATLVQCQYRTVCLIFFFINVLVGDPL